MDSRLFKIGFEQKASRNLTFFGSEKFSSTYKHEQRKRKGRRILAPLIGQNSDCYAC